MGQTVLMGSRIRARKEGVPPRGLRGYHSSRRPIPADWALV